MLLSAYVQFTNTVAELMADPPPDPDPQAPSLPDPAPQSPPGLDTVAEDWLSWGKWVSLFAGAIGLIICAIMMMIGRKNRSYLAGEGVSGIVWVLGGLSLAALAVPIATQVMSGVS